MILIIKKFTKGVLCTLAVISFAVGIYYILTKIKAWMNMKFDTEEYYYSNEIGHKAEDEIYQSYINNSFKI